MRIRILAVLAALLLPAPLMADTVYTYAGNHFIIGTGPYTTNDSIEGSFTVASPLAANLSFQSLTPLITSFNFTDGVYSDTNMQVQNGMLDLFFATGSSGEITAWRIDLHPSGSEIFTEDFRGSETDYGIVALGLGGNSANPGTWTESTALAPTPEPTSLLLVATGMVGAVLSVRRRFRRASL